MNTFVVRFRFGDDIDLDLSVDKAVGDVVVVLDLVLLKAPFTASVALGIDDNATLSLVTKEHRLPRVNYLCILF